MKRIKLLLSDDDLAEILEALHELRDPFGGRPTPLEDRLLTAQRELQKAARS